MKNENKKTKSFYIILYSLVTIIFIALIVFVSTFFYANTSNNKKEKNESGIVKERKYHVIITGNYENELFLKQVYNGAKKVSPQYDTVVEFYVPSSRAESVSFKSLFEYATFVNADGVIAYIDTPDFNEVLENRIDGKEIPLVTTGLYVPTLNQISFIGNNWWELGKKIAMEVVDTLNEEGTLYVITDISSTSNTSGLINSLRESLKTHPNIKYQTINKLTNDIIFSDGQNGNFLVLALSEESTIAAAQITQELTYGKERHYELIGFGNNETCQHYLDNGILKELISLDPEKIGESAVTQIYEYYTLGYANSYITADVKIQRGIK